MVLSKGLNLSVKFRAILTTRATKHETNVEEKATQFIFCREKRNLYFKNKTLSYLPQTKLLLPVFRIYFNQ